MSDAALDATADALARRALDALPDVVGRADLAPLAPPLGRLLEARLAAALDQATPRSPWIDDDRVADARQAWRDVARDAVRIPAAEREAEVRQAAHRALSHLVRPADTLAAVAFEGQTGPLPASVALDRVRAFGAYPYLPQIAERYVERKGLDYIDRAGLERLLRRIDRRMVSTLGTDDWLALLAPLFDWAGPVGEPPGAVSASLLRPLFLAKGADDLHDALDEVDAVDAEALRSLVAEALSDTSEPPLTPTSAPSPQSEPSDDVGRQPDAEAVGSAAGGEPTDGEPTAEPEHRPPVIGSRYGSPEFEPVHESEVLGPPRPVEGASPATGGDVAGGPTDAPPGPTEPMEDVRDAVARASEAVPVGPTPGAAPSVPVLDLAPPHDGPPPAEARPTEEPQPVPTPDAPTDPDDEPLWMRLARGQGPAPQPPVEDDDAPLWKRFAQSDLAERLPDSDPPAPGGPTPAAEAPGSELANDPDSLDGLEARVLGAGAYDRRDWFVAELFGGSPSEYHRTLDAINRAPSYTDATAVISAEVLRKRSVSPYTDCAVAFIDAVQSGFERR